MIYDILEQKILDQRLGVRGSTLFRNTLPDDCVVGVMTKAPLTGIPVDPYIRGQYHVDWQVVIRHTDPVEGNKLANDVAETFMVEAPEWHAASREHGALSLKIFFPKTLPIQFPRLEGNGFEWSQHFTTVFSII